MLGSRWGVGALVVLLGVQGLAPLARAADEVKKTGGTVAGIVVYGRGSGGFDNKKIKVLPDGQEEPVEYVLPATANRQLLKAWNNTFLACRVRLTYKMNGDVREVTSMAKPPSQARGTFTGTVVNTYGFWVIVKPKSGPPDAFAFSFPPKQAIKDTMKSLIKGDRVAIQYYTDFERHRIIDMRKIGSSKKPPKR
jgi:hypothetical protein